MIREYGGYHIVESTGHGKTVKGDKKTSSIQVRTKPTEHGYFLKAEVRFTVDKFMAKEKAIARAKRHIDELNRRTS